MNQKFLCNQYQCAVYVFGDSTDGRCPACGIGGHGLSEKKSRKFLSWYQKAYVAVMGRNR